MKTWTHLTLPCPPRHQDLLIAHLELLGMTGFVQSDDSIEIYVASREWTTTLRRSVRTAAKKVLRKDIRLHIEEVKDQNWNAAWERSMRVIHATDRIIVKPSWKKLRGKTKDQRSKIVITIDPKMSFGTGHHETTRICLKLLEDYLQKGSRVLDFGTGSGVLAIAAAKLGAKSVDAVDNDPWAVENALENVQMNKDRGWRMKDGVRGSGAVRSKGKLASRSRIKVVKGSVRSIPGKRYDLVVANIDYPTIKRTLKTLLRKTRKKGFVILSGLLLTDLLPLLELLLGLPIEPVMLESEGDWIGLALRRV